MVYSIWLATIDNFFYMHPENDQIRQKETKLTMHFL